MTRVAVVVPAYNEGDGFAAALTNVADYFAIYRSCGYEFQYVIVDDGSSDETQAFAQSFARWRDDVRILRHDRNRGLGAALRTAFREIDAELAVVLDADLSYSPATAMELLETLERENADIALASPYARGGSVINVPPMRRVLSREANRVLSLATGGRYATLTCMVRAYRVAVLSQLEFRSDGMEAVAELALCALRKKMKVVEVPATLRWSDQRRNDTHRLRLGCLVARIAATLQLAFQHRPSLWLAVPGLFPGLLPLVVGLLLLLRVSPGTLAVGTTATIVIQYTSLALFTGQITTFFGRKLYQRHSRRSNGVTTSGYDLPTHIA
jgi:dolichol-phosphate mannosyltransferase